ncbi:MAG TPA: hypothetical protein PLZ36_00900 [Armatimonadota bacterium]|nr:hypothetical protein [Armatimonadota bacterium]
MVLSKNSLAARAAAGYGMSDGGEMPCAAPSGKRIVMLMLIVILLAMLGSLIVAFAARSSWAFSLPILLMLLLLLWVIFLVP